MPGRGRPWALVGAVASLFVAAPAQADLTSDNMFRGLFSREIDLRSGACVGTGVALIGLGVLVALSRATRRPESAEPPPTEAAPEDRRAPPP